MLPLRAGKKRKAKQEAAQYTEKTAELKAKWGFEWKSSCTAPEEPKCHGAEAQQCVVAHPTSGSVSGCAEMSEFIIHLFYERVMKT